MTQPFTNPQDIAKHAIKLLEATIYERHGLKVHMGAELEYHVQFDEEKLAKMPRQKHNEDPLQLHSKSEMSFRPANQKLKPEYTRLVTGKGAIRTADNFFPDSPSIAYSYEETAGDSPFTILESIITHHGPHDAMPMGSGRFNRLARTIEALRHTVTEPPSAGRIFAKNKKHHHWLKNLHDAVDYRDPSPIQQVELEEEGRAIIKADTLGLHLNMSLSDAHGPLIEPLPYGESPQPLVQALENGLGNIFNEGMFLLLPDDASYQRQVLRREYDNSFGILQPNRGEYLEIKRPGNDSNPYYSVLLALLGVLHTLNESQYDYERRIIRSELQPTYPDITLTEGSNEENISKLREQFAERYFNGHHLITDELNALEPGLGDRFMEAVKRVPPGTEVAPRQSLAQRG